MSIWLKSWNSETVRTTKTKAQKKYKKFRGKFHTHFFHVRRTIYRVISGKPKTVFSWIRTRDKNIRKFREKTLSLLRRQQLLFCAVIHISQMIDITRELCWVNSEL